MRTKIAIIGGGPAGMLLGHMLRRQDIDCIVLEHRTRDYVEGRVRAGVLEQTAVELMADLGLDARLKREGLIHDGTNLAVDGHIFRIDFAELTGGRTVTVYGQQEVMKDLFDAAPERGVEVVFEAQVLGVENVAGNLMGGDHPVVVYRHQGETRRLACDFVVGCDGFHGVARNAIPAEHYKTFERIYPFGWLGILADVPPMNDELIYCNHAHGFALASMRSSTRSRYYIQCAVEEKIEDWSDERFWDELCLRMGPAASSITRGPSFEKSIAPLRSFVGEPMRHGRLFLAGDAAHIVPPAGAKGLNLAASDVAILSHAFAAYYHEGSSTGIDNYSATALSRVWKAERFSWWFTALMHRFPNMDGFDRKMQLAELDYIRSSRIAQASLAENYVGLPLVLE
ncbi:MAG TPA: 4-hydroxybenzoate 3-monooxygenase [Stellaceae bacterium]|jgi:p-hydroxybenzoate 3-monooxygenase|nr:4-hydroxybenzoate 3-monooxygenase [Stellaceae bacterium]